jgi:predicted nucleic acid-binding protein
MRCELGNGTDYETRMKIYLDVCCLNRPFDDQSQDRIRLEAEAVLLILSRAQNEDWVWYSSDVIIDEIEQTPDTKRRERVMQLNAHANEVYQLTKADIARAKTLANLGFSSMDALHLSCAESCGVDVCLTTDDKLFRLASRLAIQLQLVVENPLHWLVRQQESEP